MSTTIRGTVAAVHRRTNLNGQPWSEVELRDGQRVLVFPKEHAWFQHHLTEGAAVEITGRHDGQHLFAHQIAARR